MKRGILLIVLLLLLVNLAEGGRFGKAKFLPPDSTTKASLTTFQHDGSGKIDFSGAMPSPDLCKIFSPRQSQPIRSEGHPTFKLINACNNGNSGGIPL
jgi:hypothetical protein